VKEIKKVEYHAAGALVLPRSVSGKSLVIAYDNTYSYEMFRNHFKLLGGVCEGDNSPYATLEREFGEELRKAKLGSSGKKYAPKELIDKFKNGVLEGVEGFGDFQVQIKENSFILPYVEPYTYIFSVYTSSIDPDLFGKISNSLSKGMQITNEGLARIVTTDELKNGAIKGAWGNTSIVGKILGIKIQEYPFIEVTFLGSGPRISFKDYKKRFYL
jgi:hypothetical protein